MLLQMHLLLVVQVILPDFVLLLLILLQLLD
jgi:hypothetical protein